MYVAGPGFRSKPSDASTGVRCLFYNWVVSCVMSYPRNEHTTLFKLIAGVALI